MIGIVRASGSIGEAECVALLTTLRLGRVEHGADQRGVGVVELPHHLVVAPLPAQPEEVRVVFVSLDRLGLAPSNPGPNPAGSHPLPAREVRKQVTHSHAVGVCDIIEPMSQLIGHGGQLSTSLTNACQKSIPIGHLGSLIDAHGRINRWMDAAAFTASAIAGPS